MFNSRDIEYFFSFVFFSFTFTFFFNFPVAEYLDTQSNGFFSEEELSSHERSIFSSSESDFTRKREKHASI